MEKDFYTVKEISALTGLSKPTLYRMIQLGTLPAKNTHTKEDGTGLWIVSRTAYEKWMNTPDNV